MLSPDLYLKSIFDLTPNRLKKLGIFALILDVDNTLRAQDESKPYDGIVDWIKTMHDAKIMLVISSNNFKKSVEPFAESLNIDYVAMSCKPLPFGLKKAIKKLSVPKNQIAVVGDQIFTDVIGGKFQGLKTILVEPIISETGYIYKIKRLLEKPFLNYYHKKKGK